MPEQQEEKNCNPAGFLSVKDYIGYAELLIPRIGSKGQVECMDEQDFLKTLEQRAKEQERIIANMPLPKVFRTTCFWLGDHPLKIIIPLAIIINLLFHFFLGKAYGEFILKIFGKL